MYLNAVLHVGAIESARFWLDGTEQPDRRGYARRSLALSAVRSSPSGDELSIKILDISPTGFLIEGENTTLSDGEEIDLRLPELGILTARVAWVSDRYVGCRLNEPISPGMVSAALLKADAPTNRIPQFTPGTRKLPVPSADAIKLAPELNFSVAFQLIALFWAVVGSGIYFAVA